MTVSLSTRSRARFALAIPLLAVALAGCASAAPAADPTPSATAACDVKIVVDFGVLDAPSVEACGPAGPAQDVLADAGVTTEGTVDYGDQVVCRVNDRPAADETVTVDGQTPFTEPCTSMPVATAYWALWVKASPDAAWEYASEGVGTLKLESGQSIGLVYTAGTDSTPPSE
jgi:hypothetical protein